MVTARGADPDAGKTPAVELASILLDGLGELAKAGNVETACRLAGRACVRLRDVDPLMARRFDVFLHRQARHLRW